MSRHLYANLKYPSTVTEVFCTTLPHVVVFVVIHASAQRNQACARTSVFVSKQLVNKVTYGHTRTSLGYFIINELYKSIVYPPT